MVYSNLGTMTDKRPRGRPPTGNARTNAVQLRLSDDELAALERAAGETPVSTWIRDKALRAAKRV